MLKNNLAALGLLGFLWWAAALPAAAPVEAAAVEVSTPEAFTQALYDHMTAREADFSIVYTGNYEDVYDGTLEPLLERAYALHEAGSSDDFDYLKNNVSYTQVNLPSISDRTEFDFQVTYREPKAWLDQVNKDVAFLLPSLRGSTEYETVRNVHDYVIQRITYDNSITRFTAYQGLVEQSTVCQGYALLTYKLLTDLGIPCRFVSGYAGESHAWNIVKLGGQWYFLDTTWDDPVGSTPQLIYDYFLVGSDKLSKDHTLDPEFQTAAFQAAYPVSQLDYAPGEAEATAEPQPQAENQAEVYRAIRQAIVIGLDQNTAGKNASATERQVNDLGKHILLGVLAKQSDENLVKLLSHEDLFGKFIDQAYQRMDSRILKPLEAYPDSDRYTATAVKRYQEALQQTDTVHMTPAMKQKFEADLLQRISEETVLEEMQRISTAEMATLIQEISGDLNTSLADAS